MAWITELSQNLVSHHVRTSDACCADSCCTPSSGAAAGRAVRTVLMLAWASLAWMTAEGVVGLYSGLRAR